MVENFFQDIVATTDIGIIVLDSGLNIYYWNHWMEKTSGLRSVDIVGKPLFVILPGILGSRLQQAITDLFNNGSSAFLSSAWNYYTLPLQQPDDPGSKLMQSLIVKPIRHGDESFCVIQVFDVTTAYRREQLLREKTRESNQARQIAESASKAKSEFVSTVSHELRTPLTSINGSLSLILGGVVGVIPERIKGLIEIASNNTSRLLSLINDLLDIEKIEAGQLEFIFSQVDLNQLCRQAVEQNRDYATAHQVRFELNTAERPMLVSADAHRISQVITNLLSNAAKFSYPDMPITIRTEPYQQHYCRVSITNHGKGIPEQYRPTLFDKFTQVKENVSSSKGTGLGLNISRAIMDKHQGEIGFESVVDETTTFYFTLKLLPLPASA